MRIWICGRFVAKTKHGSVWDIIGVFSTEKAARAACRDETYFIAPLSMNARLPHETIDWPGVTFPLGSGS